MEQELITIEELSSALCLEETDLASTINKLPTENTEKYFSSVGGELRFRVNEIHNIAKVFSWYDDKTKKMVNGCPNIHIENKISCRFEWDRKYPRESDKFWCGPIILTATVSDINNSLEQNYLKATDYNSRQYGFGFTQYEKSFKKIDDLLLEISLLVNYSVDLNRKLEYSFKDSWQFDNSFYSELRYFERSRRRYGFMPEELRAEEV